MSAPDGGSAFPVNTENASNAGACFADPGMTLRDYFAASAPVTVDDALTVCGYDTPTIGTLPESARFEVMTALAKMRLEYADAMIAERAK